MLARSLLSDEMDCPREDGFCVTSTGKTFKERGLCVCGAARVARGKKKKRKKNKWNLTNLSMPQIAGEDQNQGAYYLAQYNYPDCLGNCLSYPNATGCEAIGTPGTAFRCVVHTSEAVAYGNGAPDHSCWILSKCGVTEESADRDVGTTVPTYFKAGLWHSGYRCDTQGGTVIDSASECQAAAADLGLQWESSGSWENDYPMCFTGQGLVWFNNHPNPNFSWDPATAESMCVADSGTFPRFLNLPPSRMSSPMR